MYNAFFVCFFEKDRNLATTKNLDKINVLELFKFVVNMRQVRPFPVFTDCVYGLNIIIIISMRTGSSDSKHLSWTNPTTHQTPKQKQKPDLGCCT